MESEKSNVTEIIEELKATPAAAECVNHGENIAVENDWLEMRYTADRTDVKRESREEKQEKRVRRRMRKEPEERAERSDGKLKGVFTAKSDHRCCRRQIQVRHQCYLCSPFCGKNCADHRKL